MYEKLGILIQHELQTLLKIISLENDSGGVEVDAFSFRPGAGPFPLVQEDGRERGPTASIPGSAPKENPASYRHMEPRLAMIGRFLSRLLRVVQFEHRGRAVAISGFRLKNLACWARYPFPSLFDNLNFGCLTSACSCHCEFCYLEGWGRHNLGPRHLTMREARTRAKYFSVAEKTGLPVPASYPGEPFAHPQILEFMRMARASDPGRCFDITTNGDFLTPETVEELARLKPITICVSLNSADAATRARIMRTKRSRTAIESIPLLRDRGIPFVGSIVTTPSLTLDDIAETARYYDRHSALIIRLSLPGYTRFHSPTARFDTDHWWGEVVRLGHTLRAELSTPVLIQPSLYWDREISGRIDGVYGNSPAERAGLRTGDLILAIDGLPIFSKAEIMSAFGEAKSGPHQWKIKYRRGGEEFTAELSGDLRPDDDYYPYKPRGYRVEMVSRDGPCLGIHVAQGFRLEYLRFLKKCVSRHPGTRRLLVFTTPLVKPHLLQALDLVGDIPECRLENIETRITIAPQKHWGGNIMIGDLSVAPDYVDHLNSLQECGYRPDLVIIPNSFVNSWGIDVSGTSYTEIERRTGIPVELLAVERIMW